MSEPIMGINPTEALFGPQVVSAAMPVQPREVEQGPPVYLEPHDRFIPQQPEAKTSGGNWLRALGFGGIAGGLYAWYKRMTGKLTETAPQIAEATLEEGASFGAKCLHKLGQCKNFLLGFSKKALVRSIGLVAGLLGLIAVGNIITGAYRLVSAPFRKNESS